MKKYKDDIFRYYGKYTEPIIRRLFRPNGLKYIILFRKCQNARISILKLYYRLRLYKFSKKTFIQIPYNTQIGNGFYIGHFGRIIINPEASLGKNINIGTGVTIGQENRGERKGAPTIGNDVWIGSNAVIVGNIKIGDDVLIAPLSYVNFDVPEHSIVIGNPAKIIHKDKATEGYINRKI